MSNKKPIYKKPMSYADYEKQDKETSKRLEERAKQQSWTIKK